MGASVALATDGRLHAQIDNDNLACCAALDAFDAYMSALTKKGRTIVRFFQKSGSVPESLLPLKEMYSSCDKHTYYP